MSLGTILLIILILVFSYARAAELITLGSFTMSRADFMVFYMRHEAYHTGQLEFLSALARG